MIRIIVCIKQVVDPEAPVSSFRVDTEAKRVIPPRGTPPVLNPFDENALEAALRIKDTRGAEIIVVSMGRNLARKVLKKSLAVGADRLVLLEDDSYDDLDSYATACILAEAIKRIGEYDLILCGRQAADTDAGVVGSGIAEILGIPSVTVARKITIEDRHVVVEHVMSDGYQVIQVMIPALVTASNELGELRYAPLAAIIAAQKKEITVWNAMELGVEPYTLKRTTMLRLFQPILESTCEFINGQTAEEKGLNLALKLRENKLI